MYECPGDNHLEDPELENVTEDADNPVLVTLQLGFSKFGLASCGLNILDDGCTSSGQVKHWQQDTSLLASSHPILRFKTACQVVDGEATSSCGHGDSKVTICEESQQCLSVVDESVMTTTSEDWLADHSAITPEHSDSESPYFKKLHLPTGETKQTELLWSNHATASINGTADISDYSAELILSPTGTSSSEQSVTSPKTKETSSNNDTISSNAEQTSSTPGMISPVTSLKTEQTPTMMTSSKHEKTSSKMVEMSPKSESSTSSRSSSASTASSPRSEDRLTDSDITEPSSPIQTTRSPTDVILEATPTRKQEPKQSTFSPYYEPKQEASKRTVIDVKPKVDILSPYKEPSTPKTVIDFKPKVEILSPYKEPSTPKTVIDFKPKVEIVSPYKEPSTPKAFKLTSNQASPMRDLRSPMTAIMSPMAAIMSPIIPASNTMPPLGKLMPQMKEVTSSKIEPTVLKKVTESVRKHVIRQRHTSGQPKQEQKPEEPVPIVKFKARQAPDMNKVWKPNVQLHQAATGLKKYSQEDKRKQIGFGSSTPRFEIASLKPNAEVKAKSESKPKTRCEPKLRVSKSMEKKGTSKSKMAPTTESVKEVEVPELLWNHFFDNAPNALAPLTVEQISLLHAMCAANYRHFVQDIRGRLSGKM